MTAQKKNILVILPTDRDKDALAESNSSEFNYHFLEDPTFKYDSVCTEFDVKSYTKNALEYVQKHNIDGIIYSHDMASLIAGLVCEKSNLPGPSLESVFLASHKYYSRNTEKNPISFKALDLDDYNLDGYTYPCYIKAPALMCSHLHFVANDRQEMEKIVNLHGLTPVVSRRLSAEYKLRLP